VNERRPSAHDNHGYSQTILPISLFLCVFITIETEAKQGIYGMYVCGWMDGWMDEGRQVGERSKVPMNE